MNPIEARNQTTEEKIEELAGKLAALPRGASGRVSKGVPAELRTAVVAAWRLSGLGRDRFSARIGISGACLSNWISASPRRARRPSAPVPKRGKRKPAILKRPSAPQGAPRAFRELTLVAEAQSGGPAEGAAPGSFCLELGSGARITGLSLQDIARLIQPASDARGGA